MKRTLLLSGELPAPRLLAEFDGIGFIRGEYVFRGACCYPTEKNVAAVLTPYLKKLGEKLGDFSERRLWYRSTDLNAAEANILRDVDEIIKEPIRYTTVRGIRRSMRFPAAYQAELSALAAIQHETDTGLVIPFLSETQEIIWVHKQLKKAGLTIPLAPMIEIPAAIFLLDEILTLGLGIEKAILGTNDMSCYLNARPRKDGATPLTDTLCRVIEHVRETTARYHIKMAVAGYHLPETLDFCKTTGVDEIIIHYSDLPRIYGNKYNNLPDLTHLAKVKQQTRKAIADTLEHHPHP